MMSAVRVVIGRPSTSSGCRKALGRPVSRMMKPAIAVQNAPAIQVNSTKNSSSASRSGKVSPLAFRMSSISRLARIALANVRPKKVRRRRIATRSEDAIVRSHVCGLQT